MNIFDFPLFRSQEEINRDESNCMKIRALVAGGMDVNTAVNKVTGSSYPTGI